MNFLLYFVLRRFFVKLTVDDDHIRLVKGLLFRREYAVPMSAVISAEQRRTPLLRLFSGRRVTVSTLSGSISFYLGRGEELPLFRKSITDVLRPDMLSVLLGAFSETRAFNGVLVFSAALSRIGSIFGSEYYDRIIAAINKTAGDISDLLDALQIAVPRLTTGLIVFVSAAWLFSFVKNILKLSRFTVCRSKNNVHICHGIITLYEQVVVPDNLPVAVVRDTALTMLMRSAPLYFRKMMILPPLKAEVRSIAMSELFGISDKRELTVVPPRKALFGHIAVPLGWAAADILLLALSYLTGSGVMLRSLMWTGIAVCVWFCILYGAYFFRTGMCSGGDTCFMAARRGSALYSVFYLRSTEEYRSVAVNPFQRLSGMCDITIVLRGRTKLRLKNMYRNDISVPL